MTNEKRSASRTLTLLPCPHCGGEAYLEKYNATFPYEARCKGCGATGARVRSQVDAASTWNRRAPVSMGAQSSDRDKLRAVLEGLECKQIDLLMTQMPPTLRAVAKRIALAAKLGAHLMPPSERDGG